MSFVGSASALVPGGMSATGGSRSSQEKKNRISSEPRTNSGREMTASEVTEIGLVGSAAGPERRPHAEQERERDHDDRRDRGERERVRELALDLVPDRDLPTLRVAGRRAAEIAREQPAEPVEVALDGRLVEAHQRPQLRQVLGRRVAAQDGARRIAQQLRPGEDEDRDGDQRQERGADPLDDEPGERMPAKTSPGPRGRGGRMCDLRHVRLI